MTRIALATTCIAVLLGCSDIESEELLTGGLFADIAVKSDGSGTADVSATLRAGGAFSTTFVELTGDDQLTATYKDETQALSEVQLGSLFSFTTEFDEAEPGVDFIISLDRTLDDGAPSTRIQLPERFEISELGVESFSRSNDNLTVSWEPSGSNDTMRVTIDGPCFIVFTENLSGDPGTFTLAAGTLEDTGDTATSCEAEVTIMRRRNGDLDPGYGEGGTAVGVQTRVVALTSDP